MGRRPLPVVHDLICDGRWRTYDVSVLKLYNVSFWGRCARMGNNLKLQSPTKLARLSHFPPASQAGHLAGPVFYVYVFSLVPPYRILHLSLKLSSWKLYHFSVIWQNYGANYEGKAVWASFTATTLSLRLSRNQTNILPSHCQLASGEITPTNPPTSQGSIAFRTPNIPPVSGAYRALYAN